jgi:hypothetical protein
VDVLAIGVRRLLDGVRRASVPLTVLGGALVAYGILSRLDDAREELVYQATVRPGRRIEIAVAGSSAQRTR